MLIKFTELASGMPVAINPSLVFAIKEAKDGNQTWTNMMIVGERYPQNVVSVTEKFEDVIQMFNGYLS